MKYIYSLVKLVERYMAIIILFIALVSLFLPKYFLWIDLSSINYLLMFIMFGMGLTLSLDDFKILFSTPKNILIGAFSQYLIMPLLALLLGKIFGLSNELLIGVILVGACPGGTASNVITYLAKGDVAFSVGMTSINTLLAPFVTPFIVYMFLNTVVEIDILKMFVSIIEVIIIPILLGLLLSKFCKKVVDKFIIILPTLSIFAIGIIVSTVISHNSAQIVNTGLVIFAVVILHNLLGYVFGFIIAKILKFDEKQIKALSIEIGMQNSGLATGLAATAFSSFALATVPGAIFSVWHNISGAIIANIYSKNNFIKHFKIFR